MELREMDKGLASNAFKNQSTVPAVGKCRLWLGHEWLSQVIHTEYVLHTTISHSGNKLIPLCA